MTPRSASPELRALDPIEAAAAAGLRYVSDAGPGIRRYRAGRGFAYTGPDGRPLHDSRVLLRIRSLAIPPAWSDVWICPTANGHIQATGRDGRRRKQYIYHADWRSVRDAAKFASLAAFGETLPNIRARVANDLRLPGLPRRKVLATIIRLLDETSIRVGNDEYRRQNKSFGLTTLRDRHVAVNGTQLHFDFHAKGGKRQCLELSDTRMARIVKQCQEIPGHELFQYLDEIGHRHAIASDDVNAYLREISGCDFTAKHFRTWNATVLAMRYLCSCRPCSSARETKRTVTQAMKSVSTVLGNTPAMCRRAYVHPVVVEAFTGGQLAALSVSATSSATRPGAHASFDEERCLLDLLRKTTAHSAHRVA